MKTINVLVKYISEDSKVPNYANVGDAGADICSTVDVELEPGVATLVPTGICVAIPEGYEIQIRPRSGLAAKNSITVLNTPGTIDSGYRGEIKVIMINHGTQTFSVKRGDRIAQMVANEVPRMFFSRVTEFETEVGGRGSNGFGSTGTK